LNHLRLFAAGAFVAGGGVRAPVVHVHVAPAHASTEYRDVDDPYVAGVPAADVASASVVDPLNGDDGMEGLVDGEAVVALIDHATVVEEAVVHGVEAHEDAALLADIP
jgi:hypothetical protein